MEEDRMLRNNSSEQINTQQQQRTAASAAHPATGFSEYPQPIRVLERPTTSPGGAATGNRGERRRRRRRATIWERARRTFFLIPSRHYTSLSNPWFFQMFIWENSCRWGDRGDASRLGIK
jgi:hypothetical protein